MIYESICLKCGATHEYIRPIAQCYDTPQCCGQSTEKRIFSAPVGIVDIPAYESPASGKMITSRVQRNEDFKRTQTRPWEGMDSEKREAARQKQYSEDASDKKLDHVVRQAWADLPPSKKAAALAVK